MCFNSSLQSHCHEADYFVAQLHTHTRFTALCPGLPRVSRYQKGNTNLDFTEARDSQWQWHQLGRMQVCTSLQTDNHANTPPLSFLQARCPSCRPTNSVKALKACGTVIVVLYVVCHILCACSSFKLFLELEPQLREIVYKLHDSKYAHSLKLLHEMKVCIALLTGMFVLLEVCLCHAYCLLSVLF